MLHSGKLKYKKTEYNSCKGIRGKQAVEIQKHIVEIQKSSHDVIHAFEFEIG